MRRSRGLSSKTPGVSHGRACHFSRDTSKTQPVGGGERRLILGYQGAHNLGLLHSHAVSHPGAYENSGCSDMTSCPSGSPAGEICPFSHLAGLPGTRAGDPSSTELVDTGDQLAPPAHFRPVLTKSLSLDLSYRPHAASTSCLLKRSSLSFWE